MVKPAAVDLPGWHIQLLLLWTQPADTTKLLLSIGLFDTSSRCCHIGRLAMTLLL
jgi:hypothetical protein